MKKALLLLLPISMMALTGCNKDNSKGGEGEDGVNEITLTKDVVLAGAEFSSENATYPTADYEFTAGGIKFQASSKVGRAMPQMGEGATSGFNELNALQLKKNEGTIRNKDEFAATKITINWLATYSTEETKYWPKVSAGKSSTGLASVTASEASPLSGTDTGKTQHVEPSGKTPFESKVYSYVSTFTLPAESVYFSVSDSGGATYITSIVISK